MFKFANCNSHYQRVENQWPFSKVIIPFLGFSLTETHQRAWGTHGDWETSPWPGWIYHGPPRTGPLLHRFLVRWPGHGVRGPFAPRVRGTFRTPKCSNEATPNHSKMELTHDFPFFLYHPAILGYQKDPKRTYEHIIIHESCRRNSHWPCPLMIQESIPPGLPLARCIARR